MATSVDSKKKRKRGLEEEEVKAEGSGDDFEALCIGNALVGISTDDLKKELEKRASAAAEGSGGESQQSSHFDEFGSDTEGEAEEICEDCENGADYCDSLNIRRKLGNGDGNLAWLGDDNYPKLLAGVQDFSGLSEKCLPPNKSFRKFLVIKFNSTRHYRGVALCARKAIKGLYPDSENPKENEVRILQSYLEIARQKRICDHCEEDPCMGITVKGFMKKFYANQGGSTGALQAQVDYRRDQAKQPMEAKESWDKGLRNWAYYMFATIGNDIRGRGNQMDMPKCVTDGVKRVVNDGHFFPFAEFVGKVRV